MNSILSAQFLRFVIANTIAAVANIATRLLASLAILDDWAVLAGFCVGLSTSYLLCKGFVFRSLRRPNAAEILRFTVINLFALGLTWIVYKGSLLLLAGFHSSPSPDQQTQTIAHAIGVASPVLFSFIAQKTFTFRQRLGPHGT